MGSGSLWLFDSFLMPCLAVVGLGVQSGPGGCIVLIDDRNWSEGSWVIQFFCMRGCGFQGQ